MSSSASNRDYYEPPSRAREDYWRYMAAPRQRVARILRITSRIRPSSLVDLGCGNGQLLGELSAASPATRLAGIDLSERQIEENRRRSPQIDWSAADLQVPLPETNAYEVVVASEVIEHLDAPLQMLENARRLAGPGGWLIITTQSGRVGETERRVGHVRHFKAVEMRELLMQSGWQPVRVWNEGFPFHDLSKWWANRDPDASMSRFGGDKGYGLTERAICFALRVAFLVNSRSRGAQLYAIARKAG